MSSYLFELNDYHAVKKAEIVIDGITVLSGLNGSGKSTVARWLHHVVKVLNEYDSMVEKEGVGQFMSLLSKMHRAVAALDDNREIRKMNDLSDEVRASNIAYLYETGAFFDKAKLIVHNAILKSIDNNDEAPALQRLQSFFNVPVEETDNIDVYADKVLTALENEYLDLLKNITKKKSLRNAEEFGDKVFSIADSSIEDSSINIGFKEDGTDLVSEDSFKMPLNLRNVIYIDTQKIGEALELFNNSELSDMLYVPREDSSSEAKAIARVIQDIIGGDVDVKTKEKSIFSSRNRYMFVSKGEIGRAHV